MSEPKIRPLSPELQEKACKNLNEDPKRRAADIAHIREWLKKQPHIIGDPDDQTIVTFLRGCKYSLERTKEKLDMFYTIRTALPEFFKDRNVRDPKFKKLMETVTCYPLPGLDADGRRVVVFKPGVPESGMMTLQEYIKMNYMVMDVLMREDDALVVNGLVNFIDVKGAPLSLATQFTPSLAKKTFVCSQDGYPLRPQGVNYFNTPSFMTPFINLARSLTREKVRHRFFVHGNNFDELYRQIPREILPKEYGGTAGTEKEFNDEFLKKLDTYHEWFQHDSTIRVDESKRPGRPKTHQDLFGLEGSFRQLEVD